VAAGAVVTKDVKAHALVSGVPAEQTGWVCECGAVLLHGEKNWICGECGRRYVLEQNRLRPLP